MRKPTPDKSPTRPSLQGAPQMPSGSGAPTDQATFKRGGLGARSFALELCEVQGIVQQDADFRHGCGCNRCTSQLTRAARLEGLDGPGWALRSGITRFLRFRIRHTHEKRRCDNRRNAVFIGFKPAYLPKVNCPGD
jgi:hypothetical protein